MPRGIYQRTETHNKHISEALLGNTPWNKGCIGVWSEDYLAKKRELALAQGLGRLNRPKITDEDKKRMSEIWKGEYNPNWKGGATSIALCIRASMEYKKWREAVYVRDNYTCQECAKVGGYLEAHHIKSFAEFPELRFAVDNGQTLCIDCHRKTDNLGRPARQR